MMSSKSPRPDEQNGFSANLPKRIPSRLVLLSAVAGVALTGALADSYFLPYTSQAAAEPVTTVTPAAPGASFADVVDHVRDAVVSVKVKVTEEADSSENSSPDMPQFAPGDPMEKFFKRFGQQGVPGVPHKPHVQQAQGSGFIISSDGYVVTNNHVVEHGTEVTLVMDDGKTTVPAKVVGTDKKTDLALLKIQGDGKTYPFVNFADAAPRVGDWVIAVGNPFGLGGTVTAGIVSARGRDIGAGPYDDFLQIDAPVNRGNSGGPTFNARGQVVGVNTAIFSPSGGSVGIGFAIPSETVKTVIAQLKDSGKVARGWIGVQIQPVTAEIADSLGLKSAKGALVAEAQPNSPAQDAGIKSGDVILGVDGEKVEGPRELARKIAGLGPDAKADLTVWHGGAEKTVSIKLGVLPPDKEAKADIDAQPEKSSLASLGLSLATASNVPGAGKDGVVIADIDPDGVAAQKGLKVGDVILEAGGKIVNKPADISAVIAEAKKDGHKAVLLRVKNQDGSRFVAIATNPAS
jgi:serine protease Do